jgi:hypothetical protein
MNEYAMRWSQGSQRLLLGWTASKKSFEWETKLEVMEREIVWDTSGIHSMGYFTIAVRRRLGLKVIPTTKTHIYVIFFIFLTHLFFGVTQE